MYFKFIKIVENCCIICVWLSEKIQRLQEPVRCIMSSSNNCLWQIYYSVYKEFIRCSQRNNKFCKEEQIISTCILLFFRFCSYLVLIIKTTAEHKKMWIVYIFTENLIIRCLCLTSPDRTIQQYWDMSVKIHIKIHIQISPNS